MFRATVRALLQTQRLTTVVIAHCPTTHVHNTCKCGTMCTRMLDACFTHPNDVNVFTTFITIFIFFHRSLAKAYGTPTACSTVHSEISTIFLDLKHGQLHSYCSLLFTLWWHDPHALAKLLLILGDSHIHDLRGNALVEVEGAPLWDDMDPLDVLLDLRHGHVLTH